MATGLTGYNQDQVQTSIKNIQSSYEKVIQAIMVDTQNKFIKGMSNYWACNEAIKYFNNVDTVLTSFASDIDRIFESVINSMNSAAKAWASNTGTTHKNVSFSRKKAAITVSGVIKENLNGTRGIDYQQAQNVLRSLETIRTSADAALASAKRAVNTCGFVGGQQAASLQTALGNIQKSILETFTQIKAAADSAIKNTINTYQKTQKSIESSFSGK